MTTTLEARPSANREGEAFKPRSRSPSLDWRCHRPESRALDLLFPLSVVCKRAGVRERERASRARERETEERHRSSSRARRRGIFFDAPLSCVSPFFPPGKQDGVHGPLLHVPPRRRADRSDVPRRGRVSVLLFSQSRKKKREKKRRHRWREREKRASIEKERRGTPKNSTPSPLSPPSPK